MSLVCPHCSRTIEFTGDAPRFCAYCGQALSTDVMEAPTLQYDATPATLTSAPTGPVTAGSVPELIGGYKLLRTLGGGGMGTVYEAEQTTTGRRVALKLIAPQYATSRDTVERFRQEGRLASAIAHPRCVFVVAADEEAGRPYIVMELMPGDTLDDLVRREGPLPPKKAIHKILDVIDGLQEAHRLGVIHRDVKPSNCFTEKDGRVKVGDFGLSKSLASDQQLTKTGSFLGTVLYSSPEQVRREQLDQQTDVYSVAATLYFLLTGRAPYQTGDAMATIAQILADPPTPPRQVRPDIPSALERVVLKGLERNREKRFRDLTEFREALLPFLQGQLPFGSVGWRLLAYLIDLAILYVFGEIFKACALSLRGYNVLATGTDIEMAKELWADPFFHVLAYLNAGIWILYFGVQEGLWGCSLGKRVLRLRVRGAGGDAAPGWPRILLRTLLCFVIIYLSEILIWGGGYLGVIEFQVNPAEMNPLDPKVLKGLAVILAIVYGGFFARIILLVSTMRARNGHRGPHELLSGTQVVQLPLAEGRSSLVEGVPSQATPSTVQRPQELPERVGPFAVHGAIRWDQDDRLLLAEDPSLRRKVWLWLRPVSQPPLSATRQNISRTSRLRWLMSSTHDGHRWDAFVAPSGASLIHIVETRGRLSWPETKPLLSQLGYELSMAAEEWTLPEHLGIEHVWVQSNGRMVLLDVPWKAVPEGRQDHHAVSAPPPATGEDSVALQVEAFEGPRSLDMPRRVASLALEGLSSGTSKGVARIRAPLPGYAQRLFDRLTGRGEPLSGVAEFRHELETTLDQPDEVSRKRRLGQLALLACFCSYWLFCCIPTFGLFVTPGMLPVLGSASINREVRFARDELREVADPELAGSLLNPNPLVQLTAVAQYQTDRQLVDRLDNVLTTTEVERQSMIVELSRTQRWIVDVWDQTMTSQDAQQRQIRQNIRGSFVKNFDVRQQATNMAKASAGLIPFDMTAVYVQLTMLAVPPLLFILWAFVIRGGLSYRLAKIALVRRDGRPAWRIQSMWRAFLVWAPITAFLVLSTYLEGLFWSHWSDELWRFEMRWLLTAALASWYAGLLLLALGVALALAYPRRALHDRLAGTYLVPR